MTMPATDTTTAATPGPIPGHAPVIQVFRFGLDATPTQQRAFSSHAGGSRYAYNRGLEWVAAALDARQAEKDTTGTAVTKVPGHFDLCKMWTRFKDTPDLWPEGKDLSWVGNNYVGTYQAALRDAATAWKNFFASRSGKRAGRPVGRPRFKTRRVKESFQVHGGTLQVVDAHHVKLPKVGVVKTHEPTRKLLRQLKKDRARIIRATIIRVAHRWYISFTVEIQRQARTTPSAHQRAGGIIGVDFGTRDLVTLSNGQVIGNPRHLEASLRKLARAQQRLSRCQPGSKNRQAAAARVARIHATIAYQRLDAIHKATSGLIHAHAVIAVEGFDVAAMMSRTDKTSRTGSRRVTENTRIPQHVRAARNRALADTSIGIARWQLASKAAWYGATVLVQDKHAATSRTCSRCGAETTNLRPHQDTWTCPGCRVVLDRRLNTATALAAWAHARTQNSVAESGSETQNARRGAVRPAAARRSGQAPMKREARSEGNPSCQAGTPGG